METFAERLKKLRKEKGLTQPEFAKEVGCSASAIASYETGRRTPNLDTIVAMAAYFDVRTAYLTGEDFVRIPGDDTSDVVWGEDDLKIRISKDLEKMNLYEYFVVYDFVEELLKKRAEEEN